MKAKILQETQPIVGDKLRASPGAVITPFPCGWHFSYLSSIDQIIHKICSFSHQEFNNHQFNNPKDISDAIRNKKDLFGRNMVFKPIKVNKSWPTAMVHSSSWDKFICPVTLLESNIDRFKEVTHQIKESIKPVIKPLLGRLKLTREVPETYNGFGSHLFESLIAAKPKKQDPKEWRRLIEFLAINIPTLDGDVSARQCAELFMQIVGKLKPGSKIVELGSWKGRSSVFASRAAGLMDSTLYCVDTWKENLRAEAEHPTVEEATKNDVFQDFKNNTTRLGCDNVVICRGNSVEIAKKWQHGSIDFIFVGASPNYDSVVEDLKAWVPHLKPGCIIWGNDWNREERLNPKRNMRSTTPGKFSVHSPG